MSLASMRDADQKAAIYMTPNAAMHTVLALLMPNLQFELPLPHVIGAVVVCLGAWVLMFIDMRKPPKPMERHLPQSEHHVDANAGRSSDHSGNCQ